MSLGEIVKSERLAEKLFVTTANTSDSGVVISVESPVYVGVAVFVKLIELESVIKLDTTPLTRKSTPDTLSSVPVRLKVKSLAAASDESAIFATQLPPTIFDSPLNPCRKFHPLGVAGEVSPGPL